MYCTFPPNGGTTYNRWIPQSVLVILDFQTSKCLKSEPLTTCTEEGITNLKTAFAAVNNPTCFPKKSKKFISPLLSHWF